MQTRKAPAASQPSMPIGTLAGLRLPQDGTGHMVSIFVAPGTPVGQEDVDYRVHLRDSTQSMDLSVWESTYMTDVSSVLYDGPALTAGETYFYRVAAANGGGCESWAEESFVYQ